MYLLVAAAIIIDSYPLKYFWVALRGYLVLSAGRILPHPPTSFPLLLSMYMFGHIDRFLTLVSPRLFEFGSPLGTWNDMSLSLWLC